MARAGNSSIVDCVPAVKQAATRGGGALQWCHQALRAPHPWPCDPQDVSLCPWVCCLTDTTCSHNCAQWEEVKKPMGLSPCPCPCPYQRERSFPDVPAKFPAPMWAHWPELGLIHLPGSTLGKRNAVPLISLDQLQVNPWSLSYLNKRRF